MPSELDLHYPPERCPFCGIAEAFPHPSAPSTLTTSSTPSSTSPANPASAPGPALPDTSKTVNLPSSPPPPPPSRFPGITDLDWLQSCVPSDSAANPEKTTPSSFIILASEDVIAFLDILPMTRGHVLVATRGHRVKVADMRGGEGGAVGFWLPILSRVVSRVTGTTDYNIVQNNGARAAQVVPHVHFHIIPRPETMPEIKSKSWTMFGRGQREELDDDEGASLAAEMRQVLREEVEKMVKSESKL